MNTTNITPPRSNLQEKLLPLLQKIKSLYLFWYSIYHTIPKTHRYTLAIKIDNLFIEIIEMVSSASFVKKEDKIPYLRTAIRKLDTLKILLLVLWETGSIDTKKYELLSLPIDEIGRMLGGWLGQIEKNSPKN
ncbi:MAG: hypothetical protein QG630_279 [Patescibacteria group bacterium]|nr:hypothetical protein [Patescibacteria group bacterium]